MKLKMEKDLIIKMIIAGVLGIVSIICIFVVISLFNGGQEKDKKLPVATNEKEVKVEETVSEDPVDLQRVLTLVLRLDKSNNIMEVYDIENNVGLTLNISSAVIFEDEYGSPIIMDSILPGYIVNVKYNKSNYVPEFVKIAPQIQIIKNLSSLTIDETLKTIQIGSDIYSYDDQLVAFNADVPLVLADLSIADDITIRAYQGKIWSIIVENGHGYIVLNNYEAYLDGRLEIGNRTSFTIIKDMRVPIAVGVHDVIITKENMTPYSSTVFIEEEQEYVIDLIDLQPKVAEVSFTIVQDNASLFINDEQIQNISEPVVLDYGEYNIRVVSEGYSDWKGILVVNQPYLPQTINMVEKPLYIHMTGPVGAEFYIDGVLIGTIVEGTPIDAPIAPGGHILTLRKEGYISWSQSIYTEDNGQDYYYTVPDLTEIPKETEPVTVVTTPQDSTPNTQVTTEAQNNGNN